MAIIATIPVATSARVGPLWCKFPNAANVVLNASSVNTGITAVTVGLPATGAGFYFSNTVNLPIACVCLNQSNIQGALGTGMPTSAGIGNTIVTKPTTLSGKHSNTAAAPNARKR